MGWYSCRVKIYSGPFGPQYEFFAKTTVYQKDFDIWTLCELNIHLSMAGEFGVIEGSEVTRSPTASLTMSLNDDNQELPASEGPAISSDETKVEPISKKAQKKAAKAVRYAEQKAERRAREKQRKKLKRAAAQLEPHDEDGAVPQSKRVKLDPDPQTKFDAVLVIDLGFDDKMSEKVLIPDCRIVAIFMLIRRKWCPYPHNSHTRTVQIGRHYVLSNV